MPLLAFTIRFLNHSFMKKTIVFFTVIIVVAIVSVAFKQTDNSAASIL